MRKNWCGYFHLQAAMKVSQPAPDGNGTLVWAEALVAVLARHLIPVLHSPAPHAEVGQIKQRTPDVWRAEIDLLICLLNIAWIDFSVSRSCHSASAASAAGIYPHFARYSTSLEWKSSRWRFVWLMWRSSDWIGSRLKKVPWDTILKSGK